MTSQSVIIISQYLQSPWHCRIIKIHVVSKGKKTPKGGNSVESLADYFFYGNLLVSELLTNVVNEV